MGLILNIIIFLVSAIPLNIAVKLLGGKTNILKTALIVFVAGVVVAGIKEYLTVFGSLIAFILMIFIYREAFRLKWLKAFLAWLLQFIVIAIIIFILLLIGISVALF